MRDGLFGSMDSWKKFSHMSAFQHNSGSFTVGVHTAKWAVVCKILFKQCHYNVGLWGEEIGKR